MNHKISSILLVSILSMVSLMAIAPVQGAIIWSDEWRLTTHREWDVLSSITEMSDGTVWVAWQSKRDANFEIYYKVHNGAWLSETRLTTNSSEDISPWITQTTNGTIWVVWSSDRMGNHDLFYKTSHDNGLSWSNATQLTTDPNDDFVPSIMQANDGKLWIAWQRKISGNDEIFYKTFNGSTWSNETLLITDPYLDKQPSIIQTRDGKIWVFWCSDRLGEGNFEIFYTTSSDNGSSWTTEEQLTVDTKLDMDPTAFQTLDGTIWVVWSSREPKATATNDLYYKTSSDNGTTWSPTIQLTTDPNDDMWPSAIQTRNKKIWIIWTSNRYENWDIYYKVTLLGDVNDDGSIDMLDLGLIARAMWTTPADDGTPGDWWAWNPACDLNKDDKVDVADLAITGVNYGKTAG